ncbi:MAG TPA: VCBS repeat-containing protein, partial [Kofleriaceae bacterium]|nr:VCBS repeat-containing protein [Kofleriaceae bacterium]
MGIAVPACDYPALPDIQTDNNEISSFEFVGPSPNPALLGTASGTIVDNEISMTYFGPVDSLIARFTTNGTVFVDGVEQESGVTAHDFSQPIDYIGVADDGETRDYRVVVTAVPTFDISEVPVDAEFSSLVFADIDGDGRLDVLGDAVVGGFSKFIVLLNRTPPGSRNVSFVVSEVIGVSGVPPVILDVNQDGKPDIVTGRFVAINTTPTGADTVSFTVASLTLPNEPFTVVAADLDGDGKTDLVYMPDVGPIFVVDNQT